MAVNKQRISRYRGPGIPKQVRPYFYDFHLLTMEGEYEYPSHRHGEYELILVGRGPYRCRLNEEELTVSERHALVIKPGDEHQDHLRDGQSHHVLHFDLGGSAGGPPLFDGHVNPRQQITRLPVRGSKKFFAELEREVRLGDAFSDGLQDALLGAFFWRVVRCLDEAALSPAFRQADRQSSFIRQLHAVFEEQNRNNVEVDEIARALHVSRRTLTNRCREYLAEPPARAYLRYRIEKAAAMLRQTDWTVQEVSDELGFDNPFHFSRAFRRLMGVSPSHYRDDLHR